MDGTCGKLLQGFFLSVIKKIHNSVSSCFKEDFKLLEKLAKFIMCVVFNKTFRSRNL